VKLCPPRALVHVSHQRESDLVVAHPFRAAHAPPPPETPGFFVRRVEWVSHNDVINVAFAPLRGPPVPS
jgi:hypothetical protein